MTHKSRIRRFSKKSPALKKSPIFTEKLLRHPGQSLNEMKWGLLTDQFVFQFLLISAFFAIGVWETIRLLLNYTKVSGAMILISAGIIVFCIIRVCFMVGRFRSINLGITGERAVGQFLDAYIKAPNTCVFHDVCSDNANVDHVIISTKGVFTIETKTYRKPKTGEAIITTTDDGIMINQRKPDTAPLVQALAQSRWLKNLLIERSGKKIPVQPIVVFPGWFVTRNETTTFAKIWIENPKMLPDRIAAMKDILTEEQVHELARYLRQYIGQFRVEF